MIDWFNSREPRERILLMIMFGLVSIFAIWFLMNRETGPDPDLQLAEAQSDRELWLRAKPRLLTKGQGDVVRKEFNRGELINCLLYTSPSPRDRTRSRMPSSA